MGSLFSAFRRGTRYDLYLGLTQLVGLDIAQNGVHISSSKPAGEAFVAFTNMDNALRALDFNRKNMGHRYGKQPEMTLSYSLLEHVLPLLRTNSTDFLPRLLSLLTSEPDVRVRLLRTSLLFFAQLYRNIQINLRRRSCVDHERFTIHAASDYQ